MYRSKKYKKYKQRHTIHFFVYLYRQAVFYKKLIRTKNKKGIFQCKFNLRSSK